MLPVLCFAPPRERRMGSCCRLQVQQKRQRTLRCNLLLTPACLFDVVGGEPLPNNKALALLARAPTHPSFAAKIMVRELPQGTDTAQTN